MKAYAVQMHLHGSMSEGPASCLAHDHMAAETGHAEVLWWTDHDFRVANFGKLRRFGFGGLAEEVDHPNRSAEAAERLVKMTMAWVPVGEDPPMHGLAEPGSEAPYAGGAGTLWIAIPPLSAGAPSGGTLAGGGEEAGAALPRTAGAARECLYELQMGAHYERFPLVTRPVVRLAVHAGEGIGEGGRVLVSFTLSEQPPDLKQVRLTYELGGDARPEEGGEVLERSEHGVDGATVALPFRAGEWNEYALDLAADVVRLGLRGGLDNSLHRLRIGVASGAGEPAGGAGGAVSAHFGLLEVDVAHRGPEVLALHRRMLESLPLRVRHHVGLEVSYYGRHITGFGVGVPIPDYEALLPVGLSSEEVVAHIHRHGGLACLAHPPRTDPEGTAAALAERGLFGADLMEVGHAAAGLPERLQLWDRLARHGLVVTGIGVSDAHSAKAGWRGMEGRPTAWVTRIWAESDEEPDLLEGLRRGHVFFADPSLFRGELDLSGPQGIQMGDVLVVPSPENGPEGQAPPLRVRVTGAQPGDLVAWLCNGSLVHAGVLADEAGEVAWQPSAPVRGLQAMRVELRRPSLAGAPFGGLIACSNPIYLTDAAPATGHRVVHLEPGLR